MLAGQYLYHVKAHALNGNNKGLVFFVRLKFSSEIESRSGCQQHCPYVKLSPFKGDTASGRILVFGGFFAAKTSKQMKPSLRGGIHESTRAFPEIGGICTRTL